MVTTLPMSKVVMNPVPYFSGVPHIRSAKNADGSFHRQGRLRSTCNRGSIYGPVTDPFESNVVYGIEPVPYFPGVP
jgi:hypothetical protein